MSIVHIGLPTVGLALSSESNRRLRPDVLVAELRSESLSAVADVYDTRFDGLAKFFTEMATDWRGWTGKREWTSLEGDLVLSATYGKSNVLVRATLASRFHDWTVTADFLIEAGEQLTRTATGLSSLVAGNEL